MLIWKSFLFVCLTFVGVRTNEDDDEFDLSYALRDDPTEPQGDDDGFDLRDALEDVPIKAPSDDDGFDLRDALEDDPTKPPMDNEFNLRKSLDGNPNGPPGGDFSDADLQHVADGDCKPDKTNSKGQVSDPPTTIDIVSDLLMALLNETSENVKRLCFSLLEMLTDQYTNAQDQ